MHKKGRENFAGLFALQKLIVLLLQFNRCFVFPTLLLGRDINKLRSVFICPVGSFFFLGVLVSLSLQ